jgi:hypothetical protein
LEALPDSKAYLGDRFSRSGLFELTLSTFLFEEPMKEFLKLQELELFFSNYLDSNMTCLLMCRLLGMMTHELFLSLVDFLGKG